MGFGFSHKMKVLRPSQYSPLPSIGGEGCLPAGRQGVREEIKCMEKELPHLLFNDGQRILFFVYRSSSIVHEWLGRGHCNRKML
jgi:hypothetical protein